MQRLRPSYWAVYRAALTLLERGKVVTYQALADELRVRKQSVWEFMKRHPDVWDFINEQFERVNAKYAGLIVRKHAMLGMQGSVASAELFLKNQAGHFARPLGLGDAGVALDGRVTVTNNFLVPRPDYGPAAVLPPVVSSTPAALAAAPETRKIPVVAVR